MVLRKGCGIFCFSEICARQQMRTIVAGQGKHLPRFGRDQQLHVGQRVPAVGHAVLAEHVTGDFPELVPFHNTENDPFADLEPRVPSRRFSPLAQP